MVSADGRPLAVRSGMLPGAPAGGAAGYVVGVVTGIVVPDAATAPSSTTITKPPATALRPLWAFTQATTGGSAGAGYGPVAGLFRSGWFNCSPKVVRAW